ncbi:equilibrative nucleobase transporter 1-like [Antennarius striatus]|uniref:equilibrative nucleobase transporter 1-like n=1 Tax=Antennarius striatus TaxID=241820 RepID=UPI0035B24E99
MQGEVEWRAALAWCAPKEQLVKGDGALLKGVSAVLGSAGLLLRTLFLMPRGHIPFPLPENFTYGLGCPGGRREQVIEEEEMQESNVKNNKKDKREESETSASHSTLHDSKQEKEISFRSCLLSWLFLWHLVWMVTNLFCQSHFLAHINPMLEHLTDSDQDLVSHYTNILAIIQLLGILFAPINGLIMDRHNNRLLAPGESKREANLCSSSPALVLTSLQCFLFCVCFTTPVLPLQYLTFVLQVANSVSFYGCHYVFISFAFPSSHFGKLSGTAMSSSALVLLLQFPIQYLIQNQLHGDPLYVNVGVTLVSLLSFCHPLHVSLYCRKLAQQRKTEQEEK